jgi:L-aspartate oxidase
MPPLGVPARLELLPQYAPGLYRLENHSHLWAFAWLDSAERSVLQVMPRGVPEPAPEGLHGVFAVRSPSRPNPIGLTAAAIQRIDGAAVEVDCLDFVDGTPILDIKPYFAARDLIFSARNDQIGRPGSRVSIDADVLVVGSGAAGLTAALNLAETHTVAVIAKGALGDSASARAQGGIAAVLEEGDSFEAHVNDTMIAGAGLNDRTVVEHVVEAAPRAIQHLIELGVPFASENGALHLTREGGHSHRRIVHVADATGWAISQALESAAAQHPNITLVPDMVAVDLVTGRHAAHFSTSGAVHGLYAWSRKKKRVETLTARATILATGGAGRAYLYSTAPRGATGDGIAMAWRAGCRISNMEFMQFHPTCLYNLQVKNFLITEAVRGEGGQLKLPPGVKGGGKRFMPQFDERAELAPRDIVARAIDHEIKWLGLDYVHLDISHREPEFVRAHFPNILKDSFTLVG